MRTDNIVEFKRYNWQKIRQKISEEKSKGLSKVEAGMAEDWGWTANAIWKRGRGFLRDDCGRKYGEDLSAEVMGIDGSFWATPVIKLHYSDGHIEELPAYVCEELYL